MSGETEKQVSGWSVDTLKEFLLALIQQTRVGLELSISAAEKANQQRFDAQQQGVKDALTAQKEAVAAALVAAEKAVLVAETNAEKWRMNANEWRGSMLDRETKFASRTEMEAELKGLRTELSGLKESRAEGAGASSGKFDQRVIIQWIIMIILALIAVAQYVRR